MQANLPWKFNYDVTGNYCIPYALKHACSGAATVSTAATATMLQLLLVDVAASAVASRVCVHKSLLFVYSLCSWV